MLANKQTVKALVATLTNMESNGWYRRVWCDRALDTTKCNMAFRFWSELEADKVAVQLQALLKDAGYTNKVKRTSVGSDYMTHTTGGDYVRVQALVD